MKLKTLGVLNSFLVLTVFVSQAASAAIISHQHKPNLANGASVCVTAKELAPNGAPRIGSTFVRFNCIGSVARSYWEFEGNKIKNPRGNTCLAAVNGKAIVKRCRGSNVNFNKIPVGSWYKIKNLTNGKCLKAKNNELGSDFVFGLCSEKSDYLLFRTKQ